MIEDNLYTRKYVCMMYTSDDDWWENIYRYILGQTIDNNMKAWIPRIGFRRVTQTFDTSFDEKWKTLNNLVKLNQTFN